MPSACCNGCSNRASGRPEMKLQRSSAYCPLLTFRYPFALRYRRARPGRSIQLFSLCSLCLCALCVQKRSGRHLLHAIDVHCLEAAFDTEDTEAQRTQRNLVLSRPFDTSGRTGIGASASGRKPPVGRCDLREAAREGAVLVDQAVPEVEDVLHSVVPPCSFVSCAGVGELVRVRRLAAHR